MAPARRHRSRTSQPELPLPESEGVVTPGTAAGPVTDWRIDEHTRTVGLQGIAAARARLAATAGRRGGHAGEADHHQAGRAA